ncbi:MAG: hypothetical protein B6U78_01135 [Candidatus Aenigmarchaeota archaeon ex4484_224]|nr:MAG: hypothetical protein B6U78_01135 [Candidatus Aenigmarchaeota archaeon ex4484_224]
MLKRNQGLKDIIKELYKFSMEWIEGSKSLILYYGIILKPEHPIIIPNSIGFFCLDEIFLFGYIGGKSYKKIYPSLRFVECGKDIYTTSSIEEWKEKLVKKKLIFKHKKIGISNLYFEKYISNSFEIIKWKNSIAYCLLYPIFDTLYQINIQGKNFFEWLYEKIKQSPNGWRILHYYLRGEKDTMAILFEIKIKGKRKLRARVSKALIPLSYFLELELGKYILLSKN